MGISNDRQFELLLWKNWLLQKRKPVLTVVQVLIPPLLAFLLFLIRAQVKSTYHPDPTVWNASAANPSLPGNLQFTQQTPESDRYWQIAYSYSRLVNRLAAEQLVNNSANLLNSYVYNTSFSNSTLKGVSIGEGNFASIQS